MRAQPPARTHEAHSDHIKDKPRQAHTRDPRDKRLGFTASSQLQPWPWARSFLFLFSRAWKIPAKLNLSHVSNGCTKPFWSNEMKKKIKKGILPRQTLWSTALKVTSQFIYLWRQLPLQLTFPWHLLKPSKSLWTWLRNNQCPPLEQKWNHHESSFVFSTSKNNALNSRSTNIWACQGQKIYAEAKRRGEVKKGRNALVRLLRQKSASTNPFSSVHCVLLGLQPGSKRMRLRCSTCGQASWMLRQNWSTLDKLPIS